MYVEMLMSPLCSLTYIAKRDALSLFDEVKSYMSINTRAQQFDET